MQNRLLHFLAFKTNNIGTTFEQLVTDLNIESLDKRRK